MISLIIIIDCKSQIKETNNENLNITEQNNNCESIKRLITGNIFLQFETNDYKIEDFILKTNYNNNKERLSDYLNSNNYLILRYNEDNCASCVDHSLEALIEYKDAIGLNNILIITTVKNKRKLKAFIDKFDTLNIKVLNSDFEINLPIEEYNIPYFFVLNKELKVKMLFIPIKELPDYTARYLDIISERFIAKNIS